MGNFNKLEKKKIKQLIKIYEEYISGNNIDWDNQLVFESTFDSGYAIFSELVNRAGSKVDDMVLGKLKKKDGKTILLQLKNALKRLADQTQDRESSKT